MTGSCQWTMCRSDVVPTEVAWAFYFLIDKDARTLNVATLQMEETEMRESLPADK